MSTQPEIKTLHVFHTCLPSCTYVFKNGKPAHFIQQKYHTDVAWEIAELNEEIQARHPHIFIKPDEVTIDARHLDPMQALRDKIIAEYEAEQAKKLDPANDMGNSKQDAIKPANTLSVAAMAQGGSGAQLVSQAKLAASKAILTKQP